MAQLICNDLTLGYDDRIVARGLNFEVNRGDYLCIIGENGSGKSTLMKALLGLHPPLAGSIRAEDGLTAVQIGYLPQQTQIQRDFPASVHEIVRCGCLSRLGRRPFYSRQEKQTADRNMEKMGVLPLARKCYRSLSGGQQQRVLLARALGAAAQMLLLDEPVTGLDPAATDQLYELIARLNREEGLTVVMITHDTKQALSYASHVLKIGEKGFFGRAEDYLAEPKTGADDRRGDA